MGVVVATEIRANSDYGSGSWLATRRLPDSFAIAAGIGAWSNSFVFADYCEAPHELASGSPQSFHIAPFRAGIEGQPCSID